MIERYTEKAINVILYAQEEAFLARQGKLYPEHILLGILREGSGISAKLLKASGIDVDIIRKALKEKYVYPADTHTSSESMTFTTAVKKILREAWYEAQSSGTYYVTPENLFLSMLREKGSSASDLLLQLNVDLAKIKSTVEKIANKSIKPFVHPEEAGISTNITTRTLDKNIFFEEEQLKKVMEIAENKLKNSGHQAFGTDQLVISMIENKDSWISEILKGEGISAEIFNAKLQEINTRKDEYNDQEPEFTPKAYKAMHSAFDIAKEFGSTYIKPEHVLLGILKENQGVACRIFKELGIDIENLSHKIISPIEKEKPEILTIIRLAKEEARRMEENILGTEQILLGILGEGAGIGAKVLRNLGVTLKDARIEVQKITGFSQHYSENKDMVFTPRARKVIAMAWHKAKKNKRNKVGSEHLLLAITGEKESIALKVLETLGVDTLEIRQGILNEIRGEIV
ncbi:MAG: hypothetical protein A2Y25_07905 [Candidatus Melainabacteria bacterium GWF2_37_15]|nr:MAG: hypothetical protein A2Y25_07905 [Candidatus Melainabacteria bacterium GWF2_37_15]